MSSASPLTLVLVVVKSSLRWSINYHFNIEQFSTCVLYIVYSYAYASHVRIMVINRTNLLACLTALAGKDQAVQKGNERFSEVSVALRCSVRCRWSHLDKARLSSICMFPLNCAGFSPVTYWVSPHETTFCPCLTAANIILNHRDLQDGGSRSRHNTCH